MARLRDSGRTSLSAPQQPWNPQPESSARNPYQPTPAILSIVRGPRRKRDRVMRKRNWALPGAHGTRSTAAAGGLAAAFLGEACQLPLTVSVEDYGATNRAPTRRAATAEPRSLPSAPLKFDFASFLTL